MRLPQRQAPIGTVGSADIRQSSPAELLAELGSDGIEKRIGTGYNYCTPGPQSKRGAAVETMQGTNSPRVLIADDHVLIAEAFRKLLATDFNVVGIVHDGRSLIQTAQKLRPDAILVDVGMPFLNGFEAGYRLRRLVPEARIIYVTVNVEPELVKEAFRQGASGYLAKTAAGTELIAAVQEAISGGFYLCTQLRSVMGDIPPQFPHTLPATSRLTDRQVEVLQLLAEGKSMKEAAAVLHLTARTVAFHKYRIMKKLQLESDAEVVQYALRNHVLFG